MIVSGVVVVLLWVKWNRFGLLLVFDVRLLMVVMLMIGVFFVLMVLGELIFVVLLVVMKVLFCLMMFRVEMVVLLSLVELLNVGSGVLLGDVLKVMVVCCVFLMLKRLMVLLVVERLMLDLE